jgi:hypothetical protein
MTFEEGSIIIKSLLEVKGFLILAQIEINMGIS